MDGTQDDPTGADAGTRPNLVVRLASDLREAIVSGRIEVGEKLPSEAALTSRYGVSRTVVREAVAALRADGLVQPRQGAGVFVIRARPEDTNPFQNIDTKKISDIVELLELRTAVECEAAGLAALRRSPAQEEAIYEAFGDVERAIGAGQSAAAADLAFHLSIARAANNPRFVDFLEMLGRDAIPRARLAQGEAARGADYLALLQAEHRRIADAIAAGDEDGARAAMRAHLKGSQVRYRRMMRGE
ncbi:FadR family transcriptional regulator [Limibaculum sp. FT325]|uniref:FadR/GntR family transcriptional regulator n=1 Tax=Thermohalobaculum sediminis TaxID=2939436 RepID=UPI0020BE716A|nr:FadR/GntR family transcriptional regulator [Limibaculum sediminis]MCL5778092.1 FadR family transcriptional regulator [Limibaculum sediminis]